MAARLERPPQRRESSAPQAPISGERTEMRKPLAPSGQHEPSKLTEKSTCDEGNAHTRSSPPASAMQRPSSNETPPLLDSCRLATAMSAGNSTFAAAAISAPPGAFQRKVSARLDGSTTTTTPGLRTTRANARSASPSPSPAVPSGGEAREPDKTSKEMTWLVSRRGRLGGEPCVPAAVAALVRASGMGATSRKAHEPSPTKL
mmetsp:Transcript_90278/g.260296  ORF Transcript_90278/g.260296 Transcript_90278/m.260296 type:complete len:203 (+) Transcript_90278:437-1045(+)